MRPTHRIAFLDRDGVLIQDVGYPHRIEDLHLLPGAVALCRLLQARGYALVIVTNQSGLARKLFTLQEYQQFTRALIHTLRAHGIHLRAVLACPHHPHGQHPGYSRYCLCRKPGPGLLMRARHSLRGSISSALLLGDRRTDLRAAAQAGVPSTAQYLVSPPAQDLNPPQAYQADAKGCSGP
ncbi:MAG: D-glycero-alpha-D-manno-heptose-1,7-bisphosphate 7-phosphatase, partial [Oceanococcaceae bacterium]